MFNLVKDELNILILAFWHRILTSQKIDVISKLIFLFLINIIIPIFTPKMVYDKRVPKPYPSTKNDNFLILEH
jgi:hypothetical protein